MAKKNEAKITFTAETTQFNEKIKRANAVLTELNAELKLNATQAKTCGSGVEVLENKLDILKKQLEASQEKTEALNQKYVEECARTGEASNEATKLKTRLLYAQNAEEKLKQAIDTCNNELQEQKAASQSSNSEVEKLTATIDEQKNKVGKLKNEYAEAVLKYGETSDEAKTLGSEISSLSSKLGENESKLKKAREAAESFDKSAENISSSEKSAGSEVEKLTEKVEEQKKKLSSLKEEYSSAVLKYGKTSDEAKKLSAEISSLSSELNKNESRLKYAESAADKFDETLDDISDSSKGAEDGLNTFKVTLANLASNAISSVLGKLQEFADYFVQLPAETQEFRQDLSTLTTSFEEMNFGVDTARQTWKDLYAVFGEDDRAVETANHISKIATSQKDLNDWVSITTGIWATYQDSLPVEGLAEASNETIKTGQVTGVLADALNWSSDAAVMFSEYMSEDVTSAEDAFNEALKKCSSEQERQSLVTETLTKLYGNAAETYRDSASGQMEAKKAAAEAQLVQAELAESIEPVTTAYQELKASLLKDAKPAIEDFASGIGKVIEGTKEAVSWCQEHKGVLVAIAAAIGIVVAGIGLYNAVNAIRTAMEVAQVPTLWALVTAQWAHVSAALASAAATAAAVAPYILIAAAIAAVIAIIVLCVKNWDKIKEKIIEVAAKVKEKVLEIKESIVNKFTEAKNKAVEIFENIKKSITDKINLLKEKISTTFSTIKEKITSPIKGAKDNALNSIESLKTNFSTKIESIKSKVATTFSTVKEKITSPIKNAKETALKHVESLKTNFSTKIDGIKSKVTGVFSAIKTKMTEPIDKAKTAIKGSVDKITGFFTNMKISFPKIKLPHFKLSGSLSISPPSVPKISVEWYKNGGIMTKPTIFGFNGTSFLGGGEAGAEAVLPIEKLQGFISNAVENKLTVVNMQAFADSIKSLASRPIQFTLNGRHFAQASVGDYDEVNGLRTSFSDRDLVLD